MYSLILGIVEKINDLNEKFNGLAADHLDNVWTGVAILAVILVVSFWAIGALNKK